MIEYRHVASRFFNRPLLLQPDQAETIGAFLLSRMRSPDAGGGGSIESDAGESLQAFRSHERADGSVEYHSPRASRFYGDYALDTDGRPMSFRRTPDGTAIITLVGEWVNRGAWVGASSGLISYEGFKYQIAQAAADSKTARIVLDMESPGGEAVGAFEAAAAVRAAAAQKPVIAVVNGLSASAAYAIASAATRIVTMPTGLCGSIGVVWLHLDFSQWLKTEGIKPTFIFAGAHKVDGNPFEPLPKEVREDAQRDIDSFYSQFIETVSAGRKISADAVRATQARVFKGQDAIDAGLADEIGTFEGVLSDVNQARYGRSQGASMSDKTAAAPGNDAGKTISETDHAQAVAGAQTAARAEGEKAGATAAQTRIKSILTAKEADGRADLANHLAFSTSMSVEDAVATLNASPKQAKTATPAASRLDALMSGEQPKVDSGESAAVDAPAAALSASVTRQLAALGKKPNPPLH
jgi:signal peptide peptidase SppA